MSSFDLCKFVLTKALLYYRACVLLYTAISACDCLFSKTSSTYIWLQSHEDKEALELTNVFSISIFKQKTSA